MDKFKPINKMTMLSKKSPDIHNLLLGNLNKKINTIGALNALNMVNPVNISNINTAHLPPGNAVSVILRNGLGNRIFQILAALGYAEKYKKICVISRNLVSAGMKSHEKGLDGILAKIFPSLHIVDTISDYMHIREVKEMNYATLSEFKSNVVLQGYFQDEKYFPSKAHIPVIRTAYYKNTFFIHIRAGDYLDPGSFGIDLVEYHKKCIADIGSGVKYIVFSNDNAYADKYMKQFRIKYTISEKIDPLEALIEMSNCAGGICANSTYSWLGGFFQGENRGKIYMPSVWLKGRDCRGIYPTWATVINVDTSPIHRQEVLAQVISRLHAQMKSPQLQIPVDPEMQPQVNPEVKPEMRPEIEPEVKPEVKPEVQPEIKPEVKPEIKPEIPPLSPRPLHQQALKHQELMQSTPKRLPLIQENHPDIIKNEYKLSDVNIINIPSGRRLNYNACIIGNRLFFRAVDILGQDEILTCLLDNFNYVPKSLKTLSLVSKFNNKHVEDPRVILHKDNYFVCYTDGYNVGIAKLDSDLNTIYAHYLKKPDEIKFEGGDGREKNWLPISMGDTIYFWYGDNPRTFLVYEDTGTSLQYKSYIKTEQKITSKFGGIRGGCSPIPYDDETNIWFFHTLFKKKYRIGAYLTRGLDIISITPIPILTGDHIVFPCGAIQHDGDFYISMGVQDKNIGILKVLHGLQFVPV